MLMVLGLGLMGNGVVSESAAVDGAEALFVEIPVAAPGEAPVGTVIVGVVLASGTEAVVTGGAKVASLFTAGSAAFFPMASDTSAIASNR